MKEEKEKITEKNKCNFQLQADVIIQAPAPVGPQKFKAALGSGKNGIIMQLGWENMQRLTIGQFLQIIKTGCQEKFEVLKNMPMPDLPWVLEKAEIIYEQEGGFLTAMNLTDEGGAKIAAACVWMGENPQGEKAWILQVKTCFPILFRKIPLLGKVLDEQDGITGMHLVLQKQTDQFDYGLRLNWRLKGEAKTFIMGELFTQMMSEAAQTEAGSQTESSESVEAFLRPLSQKEIQQRERQQTTEQFGQQTTAQSTQQPVQQGAGQPSSKESDGIHWIDIQKSIGPFRIIRIGFAMKSDGGEYAAYLYFSVQMNLSIIQIELVGLFVKIPFSVLQMKSISDLKKLRFGFQGLGITYESGPLLISGFLVHREKQGEENEAYEGMIKVQFHKLQLMAFGAYSTTKSGKTSLFVFLLLKYPIGGPPAFFVTGLAAAFGINRRLVIPDVKEVPRYPLIAMVTGNKKEYSITEAQEQLRTYIHEADGEYFIAAGVEFTSFEIMKSFVLVSVVFGKKFILSLLGISEIRYPNTGKAFIFVQLAIKAQIAPDDGIFSLEAVLTSESYLFSRDCRLRGGFAFYLWTKGANKGDFVITLGGYHPRFVKPAHYPSIDRIGVQWNIASHLSLTGEAYFAVTSSAIMAGGRLELVYQNGKLRAWLKVQADFLIQWAPFAYDIYMGVSIGVSYEFKLLFIRIKLKVELGAEVHLYGPEFAGEVRVSWHIISFTIRFGNRDSHPKRISYNEFKAKFLEDPIQIGILKGLLGKEEENGVEILHIHAVETVFQAESRIPMTHFFMDDVEPENVRSIKQPEVGVWPMGENRRLVTKNQMKMYRYQDGIWTPYDKLRRCSVVPERENVPAALWAKTTPDPYRAEYIKDVVTKMQFSITGEERNHVTPEYDYDVLTENEYQEYSRQITNIGKVGKEDNLEQDMGDYMEERMLYQAWDTFQEALADKRSAEESIFHELGIGVWRQEELEEWEIYREPGEHFFILPFMSRITAGEEL